MPRTKGSKNRPKTNTNYSTQIAEKQETIASLNTEIASITANIDTLKTDLKEKKDVSKQLHANPKAELCAFKGGEWIRVAGELVEDDRVEARQSMLDAYPSLKKMYAADDGNTEVFYFKNGVATISSFTHEPKVIKF